MRKILVVDDSKVVRAHVSDCLKSAGFNVIEAVDADDGLQKIHKYPEISLIICDYHMGNATGFSMLEKAKSLGQSRSYSVFMLTTEASSRMQAEGKKLGVTAWIVKPVDPAALIDAAKAVFS